MVSVRTGLASSSSTAPSLVLTDRAGEIGWLGQFNDITTARAAMEHWLKAEDRDDEDAAFILPIIGFGRAGVAVTCATPSHPCWSPGVHRWK